MHSRIARFAAQPFAPYILALVVVLSAALIEIAMGRVLICTCGTVKLWHGEINSAENSQHLTDWYTFTHIVHGYLYYLLLWWFARDWSIAKRFLAAIVLEAGWEVLENSPFIIDRYRTATISLDYYGDSVINSMSDIAAMAVGFTLARRLPVAWVVFLGLMSEMVMAYAIRDNLLLNVIMLIHPFDAIKSWQQTG